MGETNSYFEALPGFQILSEIERVHRFFIHPPRYVKEVVGNFTTSQLKVAKTRWQTTSEMPHAWKEEEVIMPPFK